MQHEYNKNEKLGCESKMSFDSAKEAEDTARVAAHQHGTKLKVYRCNACTLWHLASIYA